jgi:hypothetical protein
MYVPRQLKLIICHPLVLSVRSGHWNGGCDGGEGGSDGGEGGGKGGGGTGLGALGGGGQGGVVGSRIVIHQDTPSHVAELEFTQVFSSASHGWQLVGQAQNAGPYSQVRPSRAGAHATPTGFASGQVSDGGMGGGMGGAIGGGLGDGSIAFSSRRGWASSEPVLWVSAESVRWTRPIASTSSSLSNIVGRRVTRVERANPSHSGARLQGAGAGLSATASHEYRRGAKLPTIVLNKALTSEEEKL